MPSPITLRKSSGLGRISLWELESMEYVCGVKGYGMYIQNNEVFDDEADVYIGLFDLNNPNKRIVANVWLSHVKNGFYTVDMVEVSRLYKGQNISFLLYKAILKNTNVKLLCGDIQSPGGRYIWRKLIKSKSVNVKAAKIGRYSRKYDVKVFSDNTVYAIAKNCMFDIYDEEYEDYRLFAEAA